MYTQYVESIIQVLAKLSLANRFLEVNLTGAYLVTLEALGALRESEKGHVFIELLTAAVPRSVQPALSRAVSALCVIICLVLVWYTWGATATAYKFGDAEMRSLDMPKFLLLGTMPICFALMAVQFARFVFGRDTLHSGQAGVHE